METRTDELSYRRYASKAIGSTISTCASSHSNPWLRKLVLMAFGVMLVLSVLAGCGADGDDRQPVWTPVVDEAQDAGLATSTPAADEAVQEQVPGPSEEEPASQQPDATPTTAPSATPPAPLAAIVNGQYIFLGDYQLRVDRYEQALLDQGLDPDTQEGHAQLDQVAADVLESMISAVLVEQSAADLGVTVGDEELEAQIIADIAAGGGQEAFDEWLQATGQTREDYRAILRTSLLSQRVLDMVTADVSGTAEQVHARQIVVATAEEAEEIVRLLQDGSDFSDLARDRSMDVATRDEGGDLGWFPRGLVAPEMESVAFALEPGQFSDAFVLAEAYHVMFVEDRDDARELAPEMLIDLKLNVFERWLDERRSEAQIERLVGD